MPEADMYNACAWGNYCRGQETGVKSRQLAAGVAAAQQVDVTASPPPREHGVSGIIEHGLQYELTRPDDSSYAPPGPRVHHDPAFIEPLSVATQTTTTTGRMGIATASRAAVWLLPPRRPTHAYASLTGTRAAPGAQSEPDSMGTHARLIS